MSYNTVETTSRGKIVVATKDFLPGEIIMQEEPILFVPNDLIVDTSNEFEVSLSLMTACFNCFMKKLSAEQQAKVLMLYGPTDCPSCKNIREVIIPNLKYSPDDATPARSLTAQEEEIFKKVSSVTRLNSFGNDVGRMLYAEITRLAHSCAANCSFSIKGKTIFCRAIQPIKQGEEMTLSYVGDRDSLPTHERRFKYLQYKEFTCHCPRCDAEGDDTRQFPCSDPACKGVMMACQPINKKPVLIINIPYTGVKYVKPHLLPCTVCHRIPSTTYQTEMFAVERKLPDLANDLVLFHTQVLNGQVSRNIHSIQHLLEPFLKIPKRHQLSIPILEKVVHIQLLLLTIGAQQRLTEAAMSRLVADLRRSAEEHIAAQENILPWAHYGTAELLNITLTNSIISPLNFDLPAVFTSLEAKELLQKTLRMFFINRGRDNRMEMIEAALLKTLETLSPLHSLDLCAFCEESPLRAAITLSRCSRCRQVAYCSVGCQKAHWKLHKKSCKSPAAVK